MRRFGGCRLTEALPDETTILNFRSSVTAWASGLRNALASRGHRLPRALTIVDAMTRRASPSEKGKQSWSILAQRGERKRRLCAMSRSAAPGARALSSAWAMKPGRRRLLGEGVAEEAAEMRKASVRAKVEHPFLYVNGTSAAGALPGRGSMHHQLRPPNLLIAGR